MSRATKYEGISLSCIAVRACDTYGQKNSYVDKCTKDQPLDLLVIWQSLKFKPAQHHAPGSVGTCISFAWRSLIDVQPVLSPMSEIRPASRWQLHAVIAIWELSPHIARIFESHWLQLAQGRVPDIG
eukprot:2237572-Pleurochrysis_carterae.AAC.1